MGAACCIAARDGTIQNGPSAEMLHRNFRHSPTWNFHWDNRVGVADEEASIGWLSEVGSRNDMSELKSATDVSARVSDGGSSDCQTSMLHKSPLKHEDTKSLSSFDPGQSHARITSSEVKRSPSSPQVSDVISIKHPSPTHSTPSFSTLPPTSQSHLLPPSPTSCQWAQAPPRSQVGHQASDSLNSFQNLPSINSISGIDGLISMDFQTCGICLKLLTEKSAGCNQKEVVGNDLSVIAVLICGHVYHAECLETLTPEINKYDPDCPVCTFGEKQTRKLVGKLKDEKDIKGKYKRSRNRVMDNDGSIDFDYWKSRANEEKRSPQLNASSSLKIPGAKPFLRRHFSLGSKANGSTSINTPIWKKGFFWAKSSVCEQTHET